MPIMEKGTAFGFSVSGWKEPFYHLYCYTVSYQLLHFSQLPLCWAQCLGCLNYYSHLIKMQEKYLVLNWKHLSMGSVLLSFVVCFGGLTVHFFLLLVCDLSICLVSLSEHCICVFPCFIIKDAALVHYVFFLWRYLYTCIKSAINLLIK